MCEHIYNWPPNSRYFCAPLLLIFRDLTIRKVKAYIAMTYGRRRGIFMCVCVCANCVPQMQTNFCDHILKTTRYCVLFHRSLNLFGSLCILYTFVYCCDAHNIANHYENQTHGRQMWDILWRHCLQTTHFPRSDQSVTEWANAIKVNVFALKWWWFSDSSWKFRHFTLHTFTNRSTVM